MQNRNWKDIAEFVGIVAIVASLIFVGLQLRQEHQIARAQNSADFDDTMIEYARVIAENRTIWRKGLEGEELSPDDQIAFEAVAFSVWQKFYGIYQRTVALGFRPRDEIARQLASELYIFPGLRRYIIDRCEHGESMGFTRPFCIDVRTQLEKIDNGTLPPPQGKLFVL